ncbi:hypothetical protein HCCG_00880 [Helicobacter cinaedi CCUG 18818 = ATCC BAA-847]|uniref:Uncharacterized protein n=1 Tax=Helicobacter cinaedi CCUG 18818 = ATCC BAA-847 TaxID=537971 RepID=A0ABN0BA64_9HELI|nr:hypothetical protein HCCG_00880 [Helicobacter cinaedi CCUG 18818 = ATCC BAA-847]
MHTLAFYRESKVKKQKIFRNLFRLFYRFLAFRWYVFFEKENTYNL